MRKEDFSPQKKKLQAGDRVRFLNSTGGGTVTAFHGKDQVLVEDENGFDVPVLISECVVVGEADRRMENREPEPYVPPERATAPGGRRPAAEEVAGIAAPADRPSRETPGGERLNLSLAFLPADPKNFVQGDFDSYLINESNYSLYFNYMSCKNNIRTSRSHGLIEPDTKIFIETVRKSALDELEHICLQMIAFKEGKPFALKSAMTVELRPDRVKFYKLHCFVANDFFEEDALLIPLITDDRAEKQLLVSASDIQASMHERKTVDRPAPLPASRKTKPADAVIEVDLHILQLVETTAGMDSAAMLQRQLDRFHEVMKAHIGRRGRKIVFIHGKGEGVLRAALEKELKSTYRHRSHFQDASFREYGFGATMVVIH